MKVKELIEELKKLDPELPVLRVDGAENVGFSLMEISAVEEVSQDILEDLYYINFVNRITGKFVMLYISSKDCKLPENSSDW